jgi:hypothetical protein
MKAKNVLYKVAVAIILASFMSFNSCEKGDCWKCHDPSINIFYPWEHTCDLAQKQSWENQGWTCRSSD